MNETGRTAAGAQDGASKTMGTQKRHGMDVLEKAMQLPETLRASDTPHDAPRPQLSFPQRPFWRSFGSDTMKNTKAATFCIDSNQPLDTGPPGHARRSK